MPVKPMAAKRTGESACLGGSIDGRSRRVTRDSSRKLLWGVVVLVALVAIMVIVMQWERGPASLPASTATQKIETPPPASSPASPQPVAASPQPAMPPPPGPTAAAKTGVAPAGQTDVPHFDIVRVDPSGHAVLAGRAAPGSDVTVYDGQRELGHVTADNDGNWVLVPDQPLPPGQSQLSLSAKAKDGTVTRSDGVVAMLVPERGGKPATTTGTTETPETTTSATVAVLLPKEGPAKPMQLPPLAGKGEDRLSLDIIEYGTKGNIILQGRAAPGATIGAYLGNKKIGSATADKDGKWEIVTRDDIDPGRYQLKLESQNRTGKTVAQLTMPFERATLPDQLPGDLVIVQPGNSLWRIARRSYGHGIRYVEIYHANRSQITNPSLIFPGQLLHIPGKS
jgi:hypothetical protein